MSAYLPALNRCTRRALVRKVLALIGNLGADVEGRRSAAVTVRQADYSSIWNVDRYGHYVIVSRIWRDFEDMEIFVTAYAFTFRKVVIVCDL
jgi:hypothetical protein